MHKEAKRSKIAHPHSTVQLLPVIIRYVFSEVRITQHAFLTASLQISIQLMRLRLLKGRFTWTNQAHKTVVWIGKTYEQWNKAWEVETKLPIVRLPALRNAYLTIWCSLKRAHPFVLYAYVGLSSTSFSLIPFPTIESVFYLFLLP